LTTHKQDTNEEALAESFREGFAFIQIFPQKTAKIQKFFILHHFRLFITQPSTVQARAFSPHVENPK